MVNKELITLEMFEDARNYWLEHLSGECNEVKLWPDFPRGNQYNADFYKIEFGNQLVKNLLRIGKKNDLSLYVILLAAFKVLLFKMTGQRDIIVAASTLKESKQASNTCILLRDRLNPGMSFKAFLMGVKETVVSGYKNQFYPIRELMESLHLNVEAFAPLFSVFFLLENIHIKEFVHEMIDAFGNDILLSIRKENEHMTGTMTYNSMLFKQETIQTLMNSYLHLLTRVVADPGIKIGNVEIITEREKKKVLFDFNNTGVEYPKAATLHRLFEEQAERAADKIAVMCMDGTGNLETLHAPCAMLHAITYRELNERANQLAHLLREKGVKPDGIVAIMIERSLEMVVGVLAILKSGGAYLPIDPGYPGERIKYMLADSAADVLVSAGNLFIEGEKKEMIYIDSCTSSGPGRASFETRRAPCAMLHASQTGPSNLAYIIYTSGTTGRPKGAGVEHRQVVNTLVCRRETYQMEETDTSLQLFSYAFDGFVTSFFTPVISGARVVLLPGEGAKDISLIKEAIVQHGVTHFISVPSLYRAIIENAGHEELGSLKVVTLAGETISPGILERTGSNPPNGHMEIAVEYGVTEAAVMSTIYRHQEKDSKIKIGRPIWNTKILIVDEQHRLQPVGVPGELCIDSAGVARGYLNNPELTADQFDRDFQDFQDDQEKKEKKKGIDKNTLTSLPLYPSTPLYRTGDLARWLPDGNLEFLGRKDLQVKIRGFRIEPGEIENRITSLEQVKEAVVTVVETGSEKHLCAYVVSNRDQEIEIPRLKGVLSRYLPAYMIPTYFVQIGKLPLTKNGKIDRNALPSYENDSKETYAAPRNETEKKLVEIWSEVLSGKDALHAAQTGHPPIGIDDNFFERGGHSLKATVLLSKIQKRMNVKIPLAKMFELVTIRALSNYIKGGGEEKYESIQPVEKKDFYPLSPAQKRLYILQQVETESIDYNISEAFRLEGECDNERVGETFKKLIKRHESLRTAFEWVDETPVQRVHDNEAFKIEIFNAVKNRSEVEVEEKTPHSPNHFMEGFVHSFDLSKAPLLRVGLAPLEAGRHLLMVDMHHIIADGTSIDVLINDFVGLYEKNDLPPLSIQYKDYAEWQQLERQREAIKKQEAYWLKEFENDIPILDIPSDYPGAREEDFEGRVLSFAFDEAITSSIKSLAAAGEVTLFMVLLAVFNVLLWKMSGIENIVVGTPVAGRSHADLEGIIGMFVHTLAVRNEPRGQKLFRTFLREVKEKTLAAFENQGYPFEELVEKVNARRIGKRNPIFDVMLALQNMEMSEITIPGLTLTACDYNPDIAQFDIYLTAEERKNRIAFKMGYRTQLFKKETADHFFLNFREIIECVTINNDTRLDEIKISHRLLEPESETIKDAEGDFDF